MFEIGDKIISLRKNNNITQDELAEKIEISKQALFNYENNKRQIPIDTLLRIAKVFKIHISDFFVENNENSQPIENNTLKKIPIISKVSAGLGTFGIDDILDWLKLPVNIAKKADFATLIDGDSMEPKIEDGSLVLVRQNSILDNGDIGIFYLNPFTNIITLKSLNKDYKPITIKENDDFRVIGKVVGAFDYNI